MRTRTLSRFYRFPVIAAVSALIASAVVVTPARAAGILVNTAGDTVNANDGLCSLREAIQAANTNKRSGPGAGECAAGSGADTISFAGNTTITLVPALGQLPVVTSPITINGKGAAKTVIQAHAAPNAATTRVLSVGSGGNLILNALTIRNGRCNGLCTAANKSGGAIFNEATLTVKNSVLSGSSASSSGGAIFNLGTLTVTKSVFRGNSASVGGGGITSADTLTVMNSTFSGNSAGSIGGGIWNGSGTATVTNSTFSGNSAGNLGGGIGNGATLAVRNSTFSTNSAPNGGGIMNGDILTVTNSTLFANSASNGGGINNGGTLTVRNSTLSANSASNGGGIYTQVGAATLYNSIVANSLSGLNCLHAGTGTFTADSSNLDTDGSCDNATQRTTAEINLQPLASNGGPTQTMALLSGSAAIDAGADAGCPATDQRGVPRPQGSHCDIGAYESPNVTTFKSGGAPDGWVLETSENSNQGGTLNSGATTFILGDTATRQQYRSILHFNTAALPDNAIVARVTLKIRRESMTGTDPFTTHGKIAVDIRKGAFSNNAALQATDFQAGASKPGVGLFANNPTTTGWYSTRLGSAAYPYVNRTGITQFRLRFQTDDDNDAVADFIRFYSGNAITANKPILVIEYYVP